MNYCFYFPIPVQLYEHVVILFDQPFDQSIKNTKEELENKENP